MRTLRALWNPLTLLALVLVVLPVLTLALPPEKRAGLLMLVFFPGSFVAAWAAVRALRSAIERIPVPAGAPEPTYREGMLERGLRWLLVLALTVGSLSIFLAVLGVKAWNPPVGEPDPGGSTFALEPYQSASLAAVPLFFVIMGLQLWIDLASARRRRAQGLMPLPFKPSSTTGDERLDELLRPRARTALVLGLVMTAGSALANLLPPTMRIVATLSRGTGLTTLYEPWRFFTASFVHQELFALVVSILTFAALAPAIEALLGKGWLALAFVGGGFVATASSYAFVEKNYMGATGANAALTGLLLFFTLLQRHRLPQTTTLHLAVRCLMAVLIIAFACALQPATDVAAVFGGLAFGVVLSPLARPGPKLRAALEQVQAAAATPRRA